MKNKDIGQAFIIVLIVLAIGAMLIVPLLRLSSTVTRGNQKLTEQAQALYAAEGAQEYVMWKLLHEDWAQEFTTPGSTGELTIENCDTTMHAVVTMRAIPGQGGLELAFDDKIVLPTKIVSPDEVDKNEWETFTYTINLEHMSSDTEQPLEAVFDVLPERLGSYILGSTEVRIDGGSWLQADDPNTSQLGARNLIFWPSTYDLGTGEGGFSSYTASPNGFHNIETFTARQINEIRFDMAGSFNQDGIYCNWAVLKPWDTVSGPQAPIAVGSQTPPYTCDSPDNISITKIADPDFLIPGEPTVVNYSMTITNNYGSTTEIDAINDYLPQGFIYSGNPTCTYEGSPLDITDPQGTDEPEELNGQLRYVLSWGDSEFPTWNMSFNAGDTMVLSFDALATKDVSGSYYNEVLVDLKDVGIGQAFSYIGLEPADLLDSYSWNQGTVTVPTYDSEVEGDGIILDENLSLVVGGISITSFHFR
ncbi:hypothetical protein ACFLXP_03700 [Chloroflexota bacterium]